MPLPRHSPPRRQPTSRLDTLAALRVIYAALKRGQEARSLKLLTDLGKSLHA